MDIALNLIEKPFGVELENLFIDYWDDYEVEKFSAVVVVLVDAKNTIMAFACFGNDHKIQNMDRFPHPNSFYIDFIYTIPKYRKVGFAKSLIRYMVNVMIQIYPILEIWVEVNRHDDAIDFFKKLYFYEVPNRLESSYACLVLDVLTKNEC